MIVVENIIAGYGKEPILKEVNLSIKMGEMVGLIGSNGAGKSTLLKVIMGLLKVDKGKIIFNRVDITKYPTSERIRKGITMVPQGSPIFADMTVMENLEMGGYLISGNIIHKRIERVMSFFPILKRRESLNASNLSGGEQQMLSLGRALVNEPVILLLDEPSMGLDKAKSTITMNIIKEINKELKVTILMVEQKVENVVETCSRIYAMRLGKITNEGPAEIFKNNELLRMIFMR